MKKTTFSATLLTLGIVALAGLFTACKKDDDGNDKAENIVYGPEVSVGQGKARSFVQLSETGSPTAIGFTMSKTAIEGLPHADQAFILALPAQKAQTPYDHISLDWASHGHMPNGIYNKPHFDMHFYMVSQDERNGIQHPSEEIEQAPESKFLPATYFSAPGEGVPLMGKHWIDATTPELNGKPFTTTFVYGSYDGDVIFHEPMMAHDWLQTRPDTVISIPQPQAFQKPGLFPQKYSVKYNSGKQEYRIILEDLVLRQE
jgi:hypothetical protein